MMNIKVTRLPLSSAVVLLIATLAFTAAARDYVLGELKVVHPWSHATPPGATTGVAYMGLVNTGSLTQHLTGATTPAAQRVEIHTMSVEGGVMRMRLVPGLDIAPGATVELQPGGIHLMLVGLNRQFRPDETIPLSLSFADGKTISVALQVEAMGAGAGVHNH